MRKHNLSYLTGEKVVTAELIRLNALKDQGRMLRRDGLGDIG